MKLPDKICCSNEDCQEWFKPRSYTSKYCSKDCQIDARRLKVKPKSKYCPKCKETKEAKEFGQQKSSASGLSPYCKKCIKIYRKSKRVKVSYICEKCGKEHKRYKYSDKREMTRTNVCNVCANQIIIENNNGRPVNYTGTKYFTGKAYASWKSSAKRRKHTWDITKEDLCYIFEKQNGICILSGIPFVMDIVSSPLRPSLDRIDSTKGYVKDNVQFVCSVINIMKNKLDETIFIQLCESVVENKSKRRKKKKGE